MELPGTLGIGTPHFYCQGHRFHSWWGDFAPTDNMVWPKEKEKEKPQKPHNKAFNLSLETVSLYKKSKPMIIQLILDNRNPVQLEKKAKFMVQCNDAEEADAGHEEVVDYIKDFCLESKMTEQPYTRVSHGGDLHFIR